VALFDMLVNNADRKGSHMLVERRTERLFLIDHGLCFHQEEKLRTVLWDFSGEEIPADLLAALAAFRQALSEPGLRDSLTPYLTSAEIAALGSRARGLLRAGKFPDPPPNRRAIPYPPL
jgi:uncharacterized repeat protein (TIGR03843 family)